MKILDNNPYALLQLFGGIAASAALVVASVNVASANATSNVVAMSSTSASELVDAIEQDDGFIALVEDTLAEGSLGPAAIEAVTHDVAHFFTTPPGQRQQVWDAQLQHAVALGLLTQDDREVLSIALQDPSSLEDWNPQTAFGQLVADDYEESVLADGSENSGVGAVIGGVLGGIAGFVGVGPGGIAPGIAVGSAAGNLVETFVNIQQTEASDAGNPDPSGGGSDGADDDAGDDAGGNGGGGGGADS